MPEDAKTQTLDAYHHALLADLIVLGFIPGSEQMRAAFDLYVAADDAAWAVLIPALNETPFPVNIMAVLQSAAMFMSKYLVEIDKAGKRDVMQANGQRVLMPFLLRMAQMGLVDASGLTPTASPSAPPPTRSGVLRARRRTR